MFNHFLAKWNETYQETGKGLTYNSCSYQLTQLKKELVWLKEVDSIDGLSNRFPIRLCGMECCFYIFGGINRFDLSADEIAEIYKSRWAIELFFKWMKQHLNIKKFYGHSEQAVHNQVYIAMIVYCLNVLAQLNTNSDRSYLQISRYLKAALWKSAHIWIRKIKGKGVP